MPITTTQINGTIRSASTGKVYEGAIIEVYLASQMVFSNALVGNEIARTFSDTYGNFTLNLAPTTSGNITENHYVFKVMKDNVNFYRKIVPESPDPLRFEALPNYVVKSQRVPLLGDINRTIDASPTTIPQTFSGVFVWQTFDGDGTTRDFTVPNEVYIVALNGQVVTEGTDYEKLTSNTIRFYTAPLVGDLIAIQYRL